MSASIVDEFNFDKTVTFCNNGSYGFPPSCVVDAQFKYMRDMFSNPDWWMRHVSVELWLSNLKAIAPYFGTDAKNLAFVRNTTGAINAVLSSIAWNPNDVIIVTNVQYGAIRNACDDLVLRRPSDKLEVYCIDLPYPIQSEEQIVTAYLDAVESIAQSGKTPRLAIIDAISSMPAIRFPFERLTEVLSKKGVEVCIDGAHAPGQIDLDLDRLGADYFAGNLHKWFFCPKGTAVFYVAPKHQINLRGPIVSFDNFKIHAPRKFDDPLHGRFYWQGTENNTSFCTVETAVEFVEEKLGGLESMRQYNSKLVEQAAELCSTAWKTPCFDMPDSMKAPFMINIFLPDGIAAESGNHLTMELYEKCKVWAACSNFNGANFTRISAQVYNAIGDYQKLADAVKLVQS